MATPEGWRTLTLGDVLDRIDAGWSPQCETRPARDEEWGVLKVSAVTSGTYLASENKALPPELEPRPELQAQVGDVLMARANGVLDLVGRTALVRSTPAKLMLSDKILRLRPKGEAADSAFLNLLLSSPEVREALTTLTGGSHMRNVSQASLRSLTVICPPLPEQRKIAAILSSVDDVIEGTQAVIDQLQVVKKAMMAELLTRGLPDRHTRFKQTEIGQVPEDWRVLPIRAFARLGSGTTPSRQRPDYFTRVGGTPWVKTLDLNDGYLVDTDEQVTAVALDEVSLRVYPSGTVLVAMYGGFQQIGRSAVLTMPAATNQALCPLEADRSQVDPSYLNLWLVAQRERWRGIAASSRKDPNITKQDVGNFPVALPSLDEQRALSDVCAALDARLAAERASLDAHRLARTALMSVLLTGAVRVKREENIE